MMTLEQKPNVETKTKPAQVLDALIEAITDITDYLVYKRITLSEMTLFGLALFRAVWFSLFGVQNANYGYFFPDAVWIALFCAAAGIHLTGFFMKNCLLRVVASYFYASIWGFLTIIAAMSGTTAPSVPTLVIFAGWSFFLIIRLSREYKDDDC